MREYQEKKRIRKILYSRKTLVLIFIIMIFFVYSTVKVFIRSRDAVAKNDEVKKELNDLLKKKNDLEKEIARLRSEAGAEEEIRKKFNVGKPGEKILVIIDKKQEDVKIEEKDVVSVFFSDFWQKIKSAF